MTPFTFAITFCAFLALCAAFILIPLASRIPAYLSHKWNAQLQAYADTEYIDQSTAQCVLSPLEKCLLVGAAVAWGLAVSATAGLHPHGIALCLYGLSLLLLVTINIKTCLLPDVLVLPTLWAGLLFHTYAGTASIHIYGAAAGYLLPFALFWAVKAITAGKEIMGHGDLKTMAMAGAWFGTSGLPFYFIGFVLGFVAWSAATLLIHRYKRRVICSGPAHLTGAMAAAFYPWFS